jgi:Tfp pilus assembly protein PilF
MKDSLFPRIAELIKPTKVGCIEIEHYTITRSDVLCELVRGGPCEEETMAVLRVNGKAMMCDNLHERLSNQDIVEQARGRVLIAGLGLGMILHPIIKNDAVSSVTIVEKEKDVITAITPILPKSSKLQVVCGDIFTWKPEDSARYDCIYFDIWTNGEYDGDLERQQLLSKFEKYRAKGGWISAWIPFDTTIPVPPIDNMWLAIEYHKVGSYKQAEIMYKYLLQKEDKPIVRGQIYNNLGIVLQIQNKLDEAITSYYNALTLNSADATTHSNLGIALQKQGKLDEAISSHNNAIKLDSSNAAIHNNLGNTLYEQGKLVEATASYRQALICQPNFAAAYNNLTKCKEVLNNERNLINATKG